MDAIASEPRPLTGDDPAGTIIAATDLRFTVAGAAGAVNILRGLDLRVGRGEAVGLVGPSGSGKTSLLMALLGEMHYIPSGPDSFVSLPREGGVAYAAQESWVQNDTIKVSSLKGLEWTALLTTLRMPEQYRLRRTVR